MIQYNIPFEFELFKKNPAFSAVICLRPIMKAWACSDEFVESV